MKRTLVTGGAGFIGSHLCKKLIESEHQVICLDNLFTGSTSNIEELINHPNFEYVQHDVTLPLFYEVDEIYNLACPASPIHYQYDPIKTIHTSVLGATNVLELARKTGAKVLQASTSEVYGDPMIHPQVEGYWGNVNPIGPRSCYDEGKRCAETLFINYQKQYGIDIKIIRIFNTYGPNMHPQDGRVVSNFIVQALKGDNITVYGKGQQTRSFCYVDDLVDGMRRMMATEQETSGPINLGNPNEFTILELAEKVIRLTGSTSKIEYKDLPLDDPKQRKPDINQAMATLHWQPTIELEEGLSETIRYFETVLLHPKHFV